MKISLLVIPVLLMMALPLQCWAEIADEAQVIIDNANDDAEEIRQNAQDEAQEIVDDAVQEAGEIIDHGNLQNTIITDDQMILDEIAGQNDKLDSADTKLDTLHEKIDSIGSSVDEIKAFTNPDSGNEDEISGDSSEGGTATGTESTTEPVATETDIYNALVFQIQSIWLISGFISALLVGRIFLI